MLEVAKTFLEDVAVISLIAIAYGSVRRHLGDGSPARLMLGALFGAMAVFCMYDPLHAAPGIIVDMRSIPMTLSGAFLGPAAALATFAVAGAARFAIGGAGVISGEAGLFFCAMAGVGWYYATLRRPIRFPLDTLFLGCICSVGLLGLLFVPGGIGPGLIAKVGPVVAPMHLFGVAIISSVIRREILLVTREARLQADSLTDPLTGILNRRGLEAGYPEDPDAFGPGQGMLIIDIDHFKSVNDRHGHAAGDQVLRGVVERLGRTIRKTDLIARIGGEEIAVVLPDSDRSEAADLAERLCAAVRSDGFALPDGSKVNLTISVGARWSGVREPFGAAISAADAALYSAKRSGRDRVEWALA